jgi:hypothetical protein
VRGREARTLFTKRGATLESLGCSRILSGRVGPRLEADQAMTIQQLVDPVEREGLPAIDIHSL